VPTRTKPTTQDATARARVTREKIDQAGKAPTVIVRPGSPVGRLALAIRVEQLAGRIYGILAERFADAPEASAMFRRLEAEEHQHELRIEMLATTLARRPELDRALVLDLDRAERALAEGEQLATVLSPPRPRPSLHRARRLAAQLEERFALVHADQLTAQSDPELREFFEVFVDQDQEHAALLRGSEPRTATADKPSGARKPRRT
jgi:rubrerythrin